MYPTITTAQAASPANPNNNAPIGANPILSMGAPEPPAEQYPDNGNNEAAQLIDEFGNIFSQLKNLAAKYPVANTEFAGVTDALKSWLAKAGDSIVSGGGGNSAVQQNTPPPSA